MTTPAADGAPQGLAGRVSEFFYREEVPYGLAVIRILLPLSLLVALVFRWPVAREMYSTDGAPTPLWIMYGYADFLPVPGGNAAVAGFTLLVFFLVTLSVGWCTRLSAVAATTLYTWFNLIDTIGTMTKYSVVATHAMLMLCLANSGAIWSVDAWLARRRNPVWPGESPAGVPGPAWPRRLTQIMIGVVYFGAAFTKMHTPTFFEGTQLQFWLLTQVNLHNPVGQWLAMYPSAIVVFSYATIVWELMFVFLAWRGVWRTLMLAAGVMFHAGTFFLLGLEVFPMVCVTIYFAFLNERDARAFGQALRGLRRRVAMLSPITTLRAWGDAAARGAARLPRFASQAAMGITAATVAGAGLAAEHWMDPYGLRRPEGPHTLAVMDPQLVHQMLAPPRTIRHEDKVFSFDVGSTIVGGALLNHEAEFRQGDDLVAQVMFHPPHEDMVVECSLRDADDHVLVHNPTAVPRENFRTTYYFTLDRAFEPGTYSVVLSTSGQEVGRRTITIAPGEPAGPAAVSGN